MVPRDLLAQGAEEGQGDRQMAEACLTAPDGDRLLKLTDVTARVALSRAAIYRRVNAGEFPSPVKLGPTSVRWRKSEVDAWINGLPAAFPNRAAAG